MVYRNIMKVFSGLQYLINREIYFKYKIKNLQARGLKFGSDVYVGQGVEFDHGYPYLIEIQDHCRISSGTLILAHDATTFFDLEVTRLAKVRILEGTFIGRDCIILPGCTIGPRAMIAAGSIVNRDIGEGQTAAGNPARPYGKYSDINEKYRSMLQNSFIVEKEKYLAGLITQEDIIKALDDNGLAFMKGHSREVTLKNKIFWWTKEYEWVS